MVERPGACGRDGHCGLVLAGSVDEDDIAEVREEVDPKPVGSFLVVVQGRYDFAR